MVDNLVIDNINELFTDSSESIAMAIEFKLSLNSYLKNLITSPVRTLADVIAFNKKHAKLVSMQFMFDIYYLQS